MKTKKIHFKHETLRHRLRRYWRAYNARVDEDNRTAFWGMFIPMMGCLAMFIWYIFCG